MSFIRQMYFQAQGRFLTFLTTIVDIYQVRAVISRVFLPFNDLKYNVSL
jgi:hypothetical protein